MSQSPRPLRPFLVSCAGHKYIALASSSCLAIVDAMALHGVHGGSAKPLNPL